MLELRKRPTKKGEYQLYIDRKRVPIKKAKAYGFSNSAYLFVWDDEIARRIMEHRFAELPPEVILLELRPFRLDGLDFVNTLVIRKKRKSVEVGMKVEFNYTDWKGPYSFAEYSNALAQSAEHTKIFVRMDDEELANGFVMGFLTASSKSSIEEEISRFSDALRETDHKAKRLLQKQIASGSVAVWFDFPTEVRTPCEQYLLYFVQFLRDLGVEATSELKEEAGHVLFTVSPKDEKDALDKIRTALEVYLRMPASPISDSSENDIAIQRLIANIRHLEGQLFLAQAVLQAKEATIQAQHLTIDRQQRLSGEIMIDSMEDVTSEAATDEKQELLGGTLAITKYEGKGFEINLPKIFRKLRRLFADKK